MKRVFLITTLIAMLFAVTTYAQPTPDPTSRVEQFRWTQSVPTASSAPTGFKIHYGSTACPQPCTGAGTYSIRKDVGLPTKDAQGAYTVDVPIVGAFVNQTIFVSATAYSAAGESAYSNERTRVPGLMAPSAPVLVP